MNNGSILRILDANANRAREALRVLEDYARFALNDDELSATLKELRHGLAGATQSLLTDAILHRDTPGDVGTDNKTAAELQRADLAEVVTAAGKRLGEALRVIEECLKTADPAAAAAVEKLRYRFYDLEQKIARTLRPADRFRGVRLYVLITEALCKRPWLETAEEAILGGADCLQLREKDLESGELFRRARQFVELCRKHEVLSIINDRPDIALLAGADGVHVGQTDLPAGEVRKVIGREMILGVSTQCMEHARQAVLDGADYIGVGPVFRSTTKTREILPGLAYAREAARSVRIPCIGIAGITEANVEEVLATGVQGIAVTAAVVSSDDPRAAAERLKGRLRARGEITGDLGRVSTPATRSPVADRNVCPTESSSALASGGAGIPACHRPQADNVGQAFLPAHRAQPDIAGQTPPSDAGMPAEPELQKFRRRLPHWRLAGSTYYVTFRVASGELSPTERSLVLEHIRAGHDKFYGLVATIVMPDHVHMLLLPNEGVDLSRIIKGIKGVSAHLINKARRRSGAFWQDEAWDRIVRDQAELDEKMYYMFENSVRRHLVDSPWAYQWWFCNEELAD